MFLANKAAWAGIVFILLTTGISGPGPRPLAAQTNLSKEVPAVVRNDVNDVKKMQQTLRGKGHYRGEIDGVFGLRTRASIRGFQKAENLPVTGQLDAQTAGRLGVKPEGAGETNYEGTQGKPSAAIQRAEGSRRAGKPQGKAVKGVAALESGRRDSKTLQAENDNRPQ